MTRKKSHHHKKHVVVYKKRSSSSDRKKCRSSSSVKKCSTKKRSSSRSKRCHVKCRPKVNVYHAATPNGNGNIDGTGNTGGTGGAGGTGGIGGIGPNQIQTTGQFIPAGNSPTKVGFDSVKFDTACSFDLTTERFQPRVEGYYEVDVSIAYRPNGSAHDIFTFIRKNGYESIAEIFTTDEVTQQFPRTVITASAGTLVHMNGHSDYLEVVMMHNSLDPILLMGGQAVTYFTAAYTE